MTTEELTLLVFSKTLNPIKQTFLFSPNHTTVNKILTQFNNKVSVAFSNEWFSIEGERVVKFTHLNSDYVLKAKDSQRTLLVFKKFEESTRKQELTVKRISKPEKTSLPEKQLHYFEFPFNTTSGHLFYFLQQHFYPQQDLCEKLIFLGNTNKDYEFKLRNLSRCIFPNVNFVLIFESINTSSCASSFVSFTPQPAVEGEAQVTIRYCFEPNQRNDPGSIVYRSLLDNSDTCLRDILQKFKPIMFKEQFLQHYKYITFNGSYVGFREVIEFSKDNEIIFYADNFCQKCKKMAINGQFSICKECQKIKCKFPECNKIPEYHNSCSKCCRYFCRNHLQWCNDNKCSRAVCLTCLYGSENKFCGHFFQKDSKLKCKKLIKK